MSSEIKFFCGLDCEKYYMKIIEKIKDNKILYILDNSDCQYEEYLNINDAYNEMFNGLRHLIDSFFEDYHMHFFHKSFIIPKKYLSKEFVKRANDHNYIIVKFDFSYDTHYAITTDDMFNEFKDKLTMIN